MRKFFAVLAVAALLASPLWAASPPATMPNNVILMGWDGAHRDHVKALLKAGKLPNLQKVVSEGTLVDIDVTSGATDTKAGWTQILTGYRPEITGVYSNSRYRDVPVGYSVFERLRATFGADRIATVAVIGKQAHCGEVNPPFKKPYEPEAEAAEAAAKPKPKAAAKQSKPRAKVEAKVQAKPKAKARAKKAAALGHVVEEGGKKYLVFEGSPYYTMHQNVDEWHFGLIKDQAVGDKTLELLDRYGKKPFFFFVHFAEVDHSGHQHGENSKEYDEAIISGDYQLGRIVEKLRQLGVYEKTLIYVTADHGFDLGATSHRAAPYIFLGTNDKRVIRGGARVDIAPTILARLGVDLKSIQPPLDGEPLLAPATKPIGPPITTPEAKKARKPKAEGAAKPKAKLKVKPKVKAGAKPKAEVKNKPKVEPPPKPKPKVSHKPKSKVLARA